MAKASEVRTHWLGPTVHDWPLRTSRPSSAGPYVSPQLERAITASWKRWVPWVLMQLLRQRQSNPTVDLAIDGANSRRLRRRHREHVVDLMREGISMRTIRRHRLDDPRITDEVRTVLVDAAKERQSKAWCRRPEEQRAQEKLATHQFGPPLSGTPHPRTPTMNVRKGAHQQRWRSLILRYRIRRLVCEHFYLREMRDPELTLRTNRRAYVLPRQITMILGRPAWHLQSFC